LELQFRSKIFRVTYVECSSLCTLSEQREREGERETDLDVELSAILGLQERVIGRRPRRRRRLRHRWRGEIGAELTGGVLVRGRQLLTRSFTRRAAWRPGNCQLLRTHNWI